MAKWPDVASTSEVELASHESDTTNVHGIVDTSLLALSTDTRFPTAGEKAALAGTAGTPGAANKFATQQSLTALSFQPLDADLTTMAQLNPANDDVMQFKAGAWSNRTLSQLATDLNSRLATLGAQPLDTDLTTIAALTPAANDMLMFSTTWGSGKIVDANISSSAAIALTKLAAIGTGPNVVVTDGTGHLASSSATLGEVQALHGLTASRVVITDSSGFLVASSIDPLHLGYLATVTSDIQAQLDSKANFATYRKTADQTVNNSTVAVDCTDLGFPVVANGIYFVQAFLKATSPTATPDLKLVWSVPAGVTAEWGEVNAGAGAGLMWATPGAAVAPGALRGAGGNPIIGLSAGGTDGIELQGWFYISTTTTGGIKLQFAQGTATVEDTKILANSFLRVQRLI